MSFRDTGVAKTAANPHDAADQEGNGKGELRGGPGGEGGGGGGGLGRGVDRIECLRLRPAKPREGKTSSLVGVSQQYTSHARESQAGERCRRGQSLRHTCKDHGLLWRLSVQAGYRPGSSEAVAGPGGVHNLRSTADQGESGMLCTVIGRAEPSVAPPGASPQGWHAAGLEGAVGTDELMAASCRSPFRQGRPAAGPAPGLDRTEARQFEGSVKGESIQRGMQFLVSCGSGKPGEGRGGWRGEGGGGGGGGGRGANWKRQRS